MYCATDGSFSSAYAVIMRRAISPLPGRLSQLMTVNGVSPASRRRRIASTMSPNAVCGDAPSARSCWMPGLDASNSPVTWLTR